MWMKIFVILWDRVVSLWEREDAAGFLLQSWGREWADWVQRSRRTGVDSLSSYLCPWQEWTVD